MQEQGRGEAVEVLLGELRRAQDKQFHAIDGLDRKAGVVLGSASLVVGLMAVAHGSLLQGFVRSSCAYATVKAAFVLAALVYVAIMCCLVVALRVKAYYLPIKFDREEIRDGYLRLSGADAREQLLANYVEYLGVNALTIRKKATWVQVSLGLLAGDVILFTVIIVLTTLMLSK